MNLPAGWTVYPSSFRWELLVNFDDLTGSARWYRMTSDGRIVAVQFVENATYCVMSPSGSRTLLIGNGSFYEGAYGLWTIMRSIVDLRSDSATRTKVAIGCGPAWSNDGMRFAYCRATGAWSNDEMRFVSCRTTEGESHPDGGSILAVRDLGSDLVRETRARRIQCLRWRPDDRELIAVVGDQRGLYLATFAVDDLIQTRETVLPIEPTAQGISIAPDVESVSFCDFPAGDDSPEDAYYSAYIYVPAAGRVIPIGPQRLETQPIWSPKERRLAYRGWKDAEDDPRQVVAIFDWKSGETSEIATVDSDDLSGDITGPDPAWSPDGRLLAFGSYEQGGSAIYVTDVSSGLHEKVLQTNGIVHSLGFVSLPH